MDKGRDVVGLYLSPPDRALVLRVDGKNRLLGARPNAARAGDGVRLSRAADRRLQAERAGLAGRRARRRRPTRRRQGPQAKELLDFPEEIHVCVLKELDIHVVMDDQATHETAAAEA